MNSSKVIKELPKEAKEGLLPLYKSHIQRLDQIIDTQKKIIDTQKKTIENLKHCLKIKF